MKKLLLLAVLLAVTFAAAWSQAADSPSAPAPVPKAAAGNNLVTQASMVYTVFGNPYAKFSIGYDFSLSPTLIVSSSLGLINKQNSGASFGGVTAVGGESNYIFASLDFKRLFGSFFVNGGFAYQVFSQGYYLSTPTSYAQLTQADVTNCLGVDLGVGFYSKVGNNIMLIPGLNFSYNLPTTTTFKFLPSDIGIGINLGIGLDMSAK
jgi:hypothetical protein